MVSIIVAEDSPTQSVQIELMLEESGYDVRMVPDGKAALDALAERTSDIVLTDLHMPKINGLALIQAIRKHYSQIPVVMMTADGTEEIAVQSLEAGAASYIPKRYLERDLMSTLANMVKLIDQRRARASVLNSVVSPKRPSNLGTITTLPPVWWLTWKVNFAKWITMMPPACSGLFWHSRKH